MFHRDASGTLVASAQDISRFLAYLAHPSHRDEYRMPCNRTALRADAPPDTCMLQFANEMEIACTETSFGRGGLGYRMFPACVVLAEFLRKNCASIVRGRRMLELGAGQGVPGLLAAKMGAGHVVLSDYMPELLRQLSVDMARNCKAEVERGLICVRRLDWALEASLVQEGQDSEGGGACCSGCYNENTTEGEAEGKAKVRGKTENTGISKEREEEEEEEDKGDDDDDDDGTQRKVDIDSDVNAIDQSQESITSSSDSNGLLDHCATKQAVHLNSKTAINRATVGDEKSSEGRGADVRHTSIHASAHQPPHVDRSRGAGWAGLPLQEQEFESVGRHEQFDVVMGADVMYEPEFAQWIAKLVRQYTHPESHGIGEAGRAKRSPMLVTTQASIPKSSSSHEAPVGAIDAVPPSRVDTSMTKETSSLLHQVSHEQRQPNPCPLSCVFVAPLRDRSIFTTFVRALAKEGLEIVVRSATDPNSPNLCVEGKTGIVLNAEEGRDCLIVLGRWPHQKRAR